MTILGEHTSKDVVVIPHGSGLNRHIRCDDTTVVASVTDRSERDLTKRFDDIDIDWS